MCGCVVSVDVDTLMECVRREFEVARAAKRRDALTPTYFDHLKAEYAALTPACDAFLQADAAERTAIQQQASLDPDLLRSFAAYPAYAEAQLTDSANLTWLDRGIAALMI